MEDHGVDKYMKPVAEAITKHTERPSAAWTEIYNRAWEAVYGALRSAQPSDQTDTEKCGSCDFEFKTMGGKFCSNCGRKLSTL